MAQEGQPGHQQEEQSVEDNDEVLEQHDITDNQGQNSLQRPDVSSLPTSRNVAGVPPLRTDSTTSASALPPAASSLHQSQLRKQAHSSMPRTTSSSHHSSLSRESSNRNNSHSTPARSVPGSYDARVRTPTRVLTTDETLPINENISSSPEESSLTPPDKGWAVVEVSHGTAGGSPPCQRSLHTAAVLNASMYVFGGYDGQQRVNDFHAFDFQERRWSPVLASASSGPPPSPRDRHVAIVYGNCFYVFGGFDGSSRVNDLFKFDFSSMCWRQVNALSGEPPSPRHSHAAVVYDHSFFVFGGYDGSYRSDFHEYDFELSKWSVIPVVGRPPRARYRATCVVHKKTMLLFGGHDGTRHLSDTHTFDFETRTWSSLLIEGVPPIPRDSHVSVVHGDSMYVFGGSTGSAMNDLHELQISSSESTPSKWHQINTTSSGQPPIGHRFCHVGVVYMDSFYCFGGYSGNERLNDFLRYEFPVVDLNFDIPPSSIVPDLRNFVNNEALSDVTFILEGQPVYAHKLMMVRSSYFRAMFLGEMMESSLNTIRLEQVSRPIFLSVLEYLYTDSVKIPLEIAMELFVAADLFCIPRLKSMCEKRILQSICISNAASIFHAADVTSATALRRRALSFILSHFEQVSKTDSFEEMARSNVELVFEILRSR